MTKENPFETYVSDYDRWFDNHSLLYQAEIGAVSTFVPKSGKGLEIGVGTGRFASPLGIDFGIDPTRAMIARARKRGIKVCQSRGEELPFRHDSFDFLLLVTVICFVTNIPQLLKEARRVLKPEGKLILAFIDQESALGKEMENRKHSDQFYRIARFYSVSSVISFLSQAGFGRFEFCQTLCEFPPETSVTPLILEGFGKGAFVVIKAGKTQ